MGRNRLAAVLVLSVLVAVSAAAQDIPTISVENGFDLGYNLATNNIGSAFHISVAVGLTDRLQGEFDFVTGDGTANFQNYRLLGLNYAIVPRFGACVEVGQNITAAVAVAGIGLYANLFERNVQGSLQAGLKLRVDYIAPTTGFANGLVRIGTSVTVGM